MSVELFSITSQTASQASSPIRLLLKLNNNIMNDQRLFGINDFYLLKYHKISVALQASKNFHTTTRSNSIPAKTFFHYKNREWSNIVFINHQTCLTIIHWVWYFVRVLLLWICNIDCLNLFHSNFSKTLVISISNISIKSWHSTHLSCSKVLFVISDLQILWHPKFPIGLRHKLPNTWNY